MKLSNLLESMIQNPPKELYSNMYKSKFNFVVEMKCIDFLKLTTSVDHSVQDIIDSCKTADEYEDFYKSGEVNLMPFLNVEGHRIVGHEGRHRAAALLCQDKNATLQVAIKYRADNREEALELSDKYGSYEKDYHVQFEDMPDTIVGQFNRSETLSKSEMNHVGHFYNLTNAIRHIEPKTEIK